MVTELKGKLKWGQGESSRYLKLKGKKNKSRFISPDKDMELTNGNGKERTETDRMCHMNKRNADSGKKKFQKTRWAA